MRGIDKAIAIGSTMIKKLLMQNKKLAIKTHRSFENFGGLVSDILYIRNFFTTSQTLQPVHLCLL